MSQPESKQKMPKGLIKGGVETLLQKSAELENKRSPGRWFWNEVSGKGLRLDHQIARTAEEEYYGYGAVVSGLSNLGLYVRPENADYLIHAVNTHVSLCEIIRVQRETLYKILHAEMDTDAVKALGMKDAFINMVQARAISALRQTDEVANKLGIR